MGKVISKEFRNVVFDEKRLKKILEKGRKPVIFEKIIENLRMSGSLVLLLIRKKRLKSPS
jgi:hypothetical protein